MSIIKLPKKTAQTKKEAAFFNQLSGFDKFLVFSPHLDDAILSMGGLLESLTKSGKDIKVVSVFTTGSNNESVLTKRLLTQANAKNQFQYFLTRQLEDKKALGMLKGITIEHLGFTDAGWREGEDKKLLYPRSVLGKIADRDLVTRAVEKKLLSYTGNSNTAVFAPIAIGNHVDHQIVRNIAAKLFPKVYYYCDFPYSNLYPGYDFFIKKNELSSVKWHGGYAKKKKMILIYKSQYGSLFKTNSLSLPYEIFFYSTISS